MCGSIKTSRRTMRSAVAQQFVRKISGNHAPSQANGRTLDVAQDEVAAAVKMLLGTLTTRGRLPTVYASDFANTVPAPIS